MKRKIALVLAVIAVSSLGGGVYANAKTTPVAYISLDINPSVELGINTFDEVISAHAYNEDGEKVLEGTNLINSDVDNAIETVISKAISDGYVKEDGTSAIEITAATDKEEVGDKLEKSLKETADKTLDVNNIKAEVETENVALARRDEARKLGITPGKLNLIQKLQELDPTVEIEDYKSKTVKDIQKKTKELRKNNKIDTTTSDNTTSTNLSGNDAGNIQSETNIDGDTDEIDNNSINNINKNKQEDSKSNSKKEENNVVNEKQKDASNKSEKAKSNNNSNSISNSKNDKEKNKND